ncbi:pyrimidine reductase [Dictyobacter alpinus]|uniref:Pyrimidine reductase n=1 Tax=Dictyobacter alpinus TaxID=2014873 RepID=A0A402BAX6_9CHLR|nr:dihydrofolate reductase family protein [Dictyobacter alpinus]GCE28494.1 pyrimidine reductase [Dictyobacter alpinus]
MRKVVASLQMTLDGVVADPQNWSFQFNSDEQMKYKFDELFSADALLLGRITYQGFAAAWPHMTAQTGAYGERMNSLPKYVPSTTLTEAEWNASLIKDDLGQTISSLKQEEGSDILIFGSVELIRSLVPLNVIDEYRLLVYPIVVGSGKHLFNEANDIQVLKLTACTQFSSGVVLLTYQPESK